MFSDGDKDRVQRDKEEESSILYVVREESGDGETEQFDWFLLTTAFCGRSFKIFLDSN